MLKCPSCARTDADMAQCGQRNMCPLRNGGEAMPVLPGVHVVLHCGPCEKTWAIPAVTLVHESDPLRRLEHVCPRGPETCQCRSINFTTPEPAPHGESHAQQSAGSSHKRVGPKGPAL